MKKEQTLANYFGDSDGPKGIRIVKSKLNSKYAFLACKEFPFVMLTTTMCWFW